MQPKDGPGLALPSPETMPSADQVAELPGRCHALLEPWLMIGQHGKSVAIVNEE